MSSFSFYLHVEKDKTSEYNYLISYIWQLITIFFFHMKVIGLSFDRIIFIYTNTIHFFYNMYLNFWN
jgi:hypothetical protein